MKKTKLNNKGFSLVELIIVIAIMAILAAALAPQLMKYIEKSRKSTDTSACGTIKNAVDSALANEKVCDEIVAKAGNSAASFSFDITFSNDQPSWTGVGTACGGTEMQDEISETLSNLKKPKESGKTKYTVTIAMSSGKIGEVKVETA